MDENPDASLTPGVLLSSTILGLVLFALAFYFGMLDLIIAFEIPAERIVHSPIKLE